jgi:hypothetical protein
VNVIADLTVLLERARCESRPFKGQPHRTVGPLESPDGAQFVAQGDSIFAHPPWQIDGSGVALARYTVDLPRESKVGFLSEVAMDAAAVGPNRTDGVTFGVAAAAGDRRLHRELHQATAQRKSLDLDLTPLAGQRIELELTIDPGPAHAPTFDWARWHRPRIEREFQTDGILAVAGGPRWQLALGASGVLPIRSEDGAQHVGAQLPGTLLLLGQKPDPVQLPVELPRRPHRLMLLDESGRTLESAQYAGMWPQASTVGGVSRKGLFAHPPDHGQTVAHFPMALPAGPAVLWAWVGVRDGSKSDGVRFSVEVNGLEVARRLMLPGKWEPLSVDLRRWAASPIVLTLIADSVGPFDCDWAAWGEPEIREAGR